MSFVTFRSDFIATKYPGYFFNIKDNKLYSMKIDGVLKPLQFYRPNYFNHIGQYPTKLRDGTEVYSKGGYQLSVGGRRRFCAIETLQDLPHEAAVVPVKETV